MPQSHSGSCSQNNPETPIASPGGNGISYPRGDKFGLTAPTLVVLGGRSEPLAPEAVGKLVRAAPRARTIDVAAAGHMIPVDTNDPFTAAVRDLFASLR